MRESNGKGGCQHNWRSAQDPALGCLFMNDESERETVLFTVCREVTQAGPKQRSHRPRPQRTGAGLRHALRGWTEWGVLHIPHHVRLDRLGPCDRFDHGWVVHLL